MKGKILWIGAILLLIGLIAGVFLSGHTDPQEDIPDGKFSPTTSASKISCQDDAPFEYHDTVNEEFTVEKMKDSFDMGGVVKKVVIFGKTNGIPTDGTYDVVGVLSKVDTEKRTVVISSEKDSMEVYVGKNVNIISSKGSVSWEDLWQKEGYNIYLLVAQKNEEPLFVISGSIWE